MHYVPLRIHTKYSPLLSLIEPVALPRLIRSLDLENFAVVDRGVLFGWDRVASRMKGSGAEPIQGAELEVLFEAPGRGTLPRVYTLNLYAVSPEGRENLTNLCRSIWSRERSEKLCGIATLGEVEEHSDGLIALSGGMTGPISGALIRGRAGEALRAAARLAAIFSPDRFYLEVSRTGSQSEELVDPFLRKLEERHGIPRVAADPVRYLARGDRWRLTALRSVLPPAGTVSSPDPMEFEGRMHLPSDREMRERYRDDLRPLERTREIAARCSRSRGECPGEENAPGGGDELIGVCQARINLLYEGEAVLRKKEIRNRFWSEYWKLEAGGNLPIVQQLSRLFESVRDCDDHAEIFTPYLSGSLIGFLAGLQQVDPERIDASFGDLPVRSVRDRTELKIVGDARSIDRFRTILIQRCGDAIQPYLVPVLLSKADRKRLETAMLSSRGEWSGQISNRSTQYPFEAQNRENHRPDPLLEDELLSVPMKSVATYRELDTKLLWLERPDQTWSESGGFELEIRRSPMLDAVGATAAIPPAGNPFPVLNRGDWTGLVPGDHLLAGKIVRKLRPQSVDDVALLLAAGVDGGERYNLVKRIASIRAGEKPSPIQGSSVDAILESTEGVPFYREQIVGVIATLTGMGTFESESFFARIAAREGGQTPADRTLFIRRGVEKGTSLPFLEKVFSVLLSLAPSAVGRGEVYSYAEKLTLLCARKKRDPLRFARQVLNAELMGRAKVHQLTEGFQREGIVFLPVDRNLSGFQFKLENGAIRTGFAMIPGFTRSLGERVVAERKRGGDFSTLAEFLQRLAACHFPRPALLRIAQSLENSREVATISHETQQPARRRFGPEIRQTLPGRRKRRRGAGQGRERQIALPFDGASTARSG